MKAAKNKLKRHAARRSKAEEKAKKRRTKKNGRKPQPSHSSAPESPFPARKRLFWVAHGVNCMLSDYGQGTWTPLFDGIYEGRVPSTQQEITTRVMQRFQGLKDWPPEAKAALAWSIADARLLHLYWREAERRMRRAHPELDDVESLICRPADGCVWDLFSYLKQHMLQRKTL